MPKSHSADLLEGERVDAIVKPHPLSFLKYDAVAIFLIVLMLFLQWFYSYIQTNQPLLDMLKVPFGVIGTMRTEDLALMILFWGLLLLTGLIIGVLWVSKMPLLYMVLIGASGTLLEVFYPQFSTFLALPQSMQPPMTKLWLLAGFAGLSVILIELYRRGHEYILTNYRIITRKTFISKEEREVMYDKITDTYLIQGLLGRLFNYGTIIHVSASSFGLGEDSASVSILTGAAGKKGLVGVSFGGAKGVQRPRAATYFSFFGVPDPKKIRAMISEHQLEFKETPVLKRIENLLKEKNEQKEKKDSK